MIPKIRHHQSLKAALKKHPIMTAKELLPILGSHVAIKRAAEAGLINRLGSGIYSSPALDPFAAAVLAASKMFSGCVISGITALVVLGLSDERVDKVDVDIAIPRNLRNKLLNVHRIAKNRLTGVVALRFHSHVINIYNPERTLCGAYRIDPEGPLFLKALKRYVKKHTVNSDLIAKYDRLLKTRVLMHLRQELSNE